MLLEALDGRSADLVVTDPPYNVDYRGKTAEHLQIDNDDQPTAAFYDFMLAAYTALFDVAEPGTPIYVFQAPNETDIRAFRIAFTEAGWLHKQMLVWIKHHFVMSRQDYHGQHEPILYGWKPGAAHRWFGGFTPSSIIADDQLPVDKMSKAELAAIVEGLYETTTVLRADRPAKSLDHPTAKPVELLTRLIENSSRPGGVVLDPFGGGGSTLIACHHTGRTAVLVELDPRYADVICRRWQEHTGQRPVLASTGKAHDFVR